MPSPNAQQFCGEEPAEPEVHPEGQAAASPCSKGTWVGTGQDPPGALRAGSTRETSTEDVRHTQTPVILTLIWGVLCDRTTMQSEQSTSGSSEKKKARMLQNHQEQIRTVCRILCNLMGSSWKTDKKLQQFHRQNVCFCRFLTQTISQQCNPKHRIFVTFGATPKPQIEKRGSVCASIRMEIRPVLTAQSSGGWIDAFILFS